jgi:type IV secretion system protein VirB9
MGMIRYLVLLLALLQMPLAAQAKIDSGSMLSDFEAGVKLRDPRIRVIDYDADRVFVITGHTGYQITMEFEAGEKVETVGIGDSSGWQITPNGNGTLLFLKPMAVVPVTNMTLVTNKRRYNLELSSRSGVKVNRNSITYVLRFRLPAPVVVKSAQDENQISRVPEGLWNRNYRFEGSKALVPEEVFDDGRYTYIRFAETVETPAIFAVSGAEDENLVNSNMRGSYIIIDQVSEQIVLRQGKLVTRLYNEKHSIAEPGPNAPKPRPRKKRGLLGLGM